MKVRFLRGAPTRVRPPSLSKPSRFRRGRDSDARPANATPATLGSLIFLSRWLHAPLYLGLIVAQGVYVYRFMVELGHLLHDIRSPKETAIMLSVLGLIDVVMIANLLIMVIIGGYETFVSRLKLQGTRTARSGSRT